MKNKDEIKESLEKYEKEVEESKKYLKNKIGDELLTISFWELYTYPITYKSKRVSDLMKIKSLVHESRIQKDWDFPYQINTGINSNFSKGIQHFLKSDKYFEYFRMYRSGLFTWEKAFIEDNNEPKYNKVLYLNLAFSLISKICHFIKSYYNKINYDDILIFKIALNGTEDRILKNQIIYPSYVSHEDPIIYEDEINLKEFDAFEKTKEICKFICWVFNWEDITDDYIMVSLQELKRS